jgi:hypothetical protein
LRNLRKLEEGLIEMKFSTCLTREGTMAIRGSSGTEGPIMVDLSFGIGIVLVELKMGNFS